MMLLLHDLSTNPQTTELGAVKQLVCVSVLQRGQYGEVCNVVWV